MALRTLIFSILEQSIGRAFTEFKFTEFYIALFCYQSSKGPKITHENMSDDEKRIVREYFAAFMHLANIDIPTYDIVARSSVGAKVHSGMSEYRVNVAPEFGCVFWDSPDYDLMSSSISNLALSNESGFAEIGALSRRNSNGEVNEFIELSSRLRNTIVPEYDLTD